jgi:hypothetical protein
LVDNEQESFQRTSLLPTDMRDDQRGRTKLSENIRASVRRPEDVKFRMPEEEKASKNL